jgi:hypothetical protein
MFWHKSAWKPVEDVMALARAEQSNCLQFNTGALDKNAGGQLTGEFTVQFTPAPL